MTTPFIVIYIACINWIYIEILKVVILNTKLSPNFCTQLWTHTLSFVKYGCLYLLVYSSPIAAAFLSKSHLWSWHTHGTTHIVNSPPPDLPPHISTVNRWLNQGLGNVCNPVTINWGHLTVQVHLHNYTVRSWNAKSCISIIRTDCDWVTQVTRNRDLVIYLLYSYHTCVFSCDWWVCQHSDICVHTHYTHTS